MASDATLALIVNDVVATTGTVGTKWHGGRGTFIVEATAWNAGTVTLQYRSPNGTFITVDATNAVLSANGMVGIELPPGEIRAASNGLPTGVYAWLIGTRVD
jgi:uncharacterized membrane protein AbrB (regulator of aidB expression)